MDVYKFDFLFLLKLVILVSHHWWRLPWESNSNVAFIWSLITCVHLSYLLCLATMKKDCTIRRSFRTVLSTMILLSVYTWPSLWSVPQENDARMFGLFSSVSVTPPKKDLQAPKLVRPETHVHNDRKYPQDGSRLTSCPFCLSAGR